jgi:hypothetical protein
MRTFSLALLAAASFAACTPYNPDLGMTPFLCGAQEPRCPSGYECKLEEMMGSATPREVCMAAAEIIPPDASNCADDKALEPNDSKDTAWVTPVDMTTQPFTLAQLAICPATDKDNYQVMISTANRNLEMILEFENGGPELVGAIANNMGVPIANASPTVANTKRAYVPNLSVGLYYVQVYGMNGATAGNNYKLTITANGP